MGIYDEQIKSRIENDEVAFSNAFMGMSGVIMGEKVLRAMSDNQIQTKAAIERILKFYRIQYPELPPELTDLNDQLDYLLRPSGVMRRVVNLEDNWYQSATGCFIAIRKDNKTAVAVFPGKVIGYYFIDEETGKKVHLNKNTAALLETEAMCFYRPLPMRSIGFKELMLFCLKSIPAADVRLVIFLTLITTLVGLILPKINNLIYSTLVYSENMQLFFAVFVFLFCTTITITLMNKLKAIFMGRLNTGMGTAIQAAGMIRLLSLPSSFFRGYSSGELTSRNANLSSLCSEVFSTVLSNGLSSVFSLAYLSQMIKYAPGLVIPSLIIILATIAFSLISTFTSMKYLKLTLESEAKEAGVTHALVSGLQKIKLAGAEKRAFAKWAESYTVNAKYTYDPPKYVTLSSTIAIALDLIGTIVIYFFSFRTNVSLANYLSFNTAYAMVFAAFSSIISVAKMISSIRPKYEMVKPLLETVPEVNAEKEEVTQLSGDIQLDNVTFRYEENGPAIIDNMSLHIKRGQYIGIVGTTGCGKSTLMRIILGFEKPEKGAVYFDGKNLSSLDLKSVRRHIGTVMQDGKLFLGDIFANIVITNPRLTMDEAWDAAEKAGIADDIRRMPMGMHTIISENAGGGVSGGQRQRLLIARAIAPKPSILFFDEATSALDNVTQKHVSDSLDSLNCTRIVIAHRLSTIKHCDRIIMLDKGHIVEDGTYDELIALGGAFAKLVERQRIDTDMN